MPTESISAGARIVRLFYQDDDDGDVVAAALVSSGKHRVDGLARIKGVIHSDSPPAANYPRVSFSPDGTNWTHTRVLARDDTQAGYAYVLDLAIEGPYVRVQWTQGATDDELRAYVYATAGGAGAGGSASGAGTTGGRQVATSDKDTQFAAAINAGEHATANLAGLGSSKGTVRQVALIAQEALDYEVHFWSSDTFAAADSDADAWLGYVELLASDARSIGNAEAHYRYRAEVELPYVDADNTGELHVSLVPTSGAKGGAGVGDVTLRIVFDPE